MALGCTCASGIRSGDGAAKGIGVRWFCCMSHCSLRLPKDMRSIAYLRKTDLEEAHPTATINYTDKTDNARSRNT